MKVLTGHLTQTEKKAIKTILNAGLMSGRVGRKDYFMVLKNRIYTVKIYQVNKDPMAWNTTNQIQEMTSTFTFK